MKISRDRVLLRGRYGWPQMSVPFDNGAIHAPSGYRANAAGYISMCFDIPLDAPHSLAGLSTVALEADGWFYEIKPIDMKPGDVLGLLGPGSLGTEGGVAVLFETWLNNDYQTNVTINWEMLPENSPGPVRRARPYNGNTWHSYRFRDIVD